MQILSVGKPYQAGKTAWPEVLVYNYDEAGHRLEIFLRTPSQAEIEAIWHGDDTRFGLLVERDAIFLCFQFRHQGKLVFWGETPYTWHMVDPDYRALPDLANLSPEEGWALSVILVNAENGLVAGLRVLALTHSFSQALGAAIRRQAKRPFDQDSYDEQLRRIFDAYDSKQLWRFCSIKSKAGEKD